jgi:hypothetical protein
MKKHPAILRLQEEREKIKTPVRRPAFLFWYA